MIGTDECYSCAGESKLESLPLWERIASDDLWRVAHAFNSALPGWLVLMPRRHVTSIAELTDAEAAALGGWQVRLARALSAVLGCQKTYVVQFAEAEGFSHVHFHIVARPPDLPADRRGPRVFEFLRQDPAEHVTPDQMNELARALSSQLATQRPNSQPLSGDPEQQ